MIAKRTDGGLAPQQPWPKCGCTGGCSRLWLLCLFAFALASGCSTTALFHYRVLYSDPPGDRPAFFSIPLETGQIVVSEAPGPHSLMFGLAPATFYRFTHSGIIVIDQRTHEPYVYDMSAEFKPTLANSPPDALRGGMRRTPFFDYVGILLYVEVIDPAGKADKTKMVARVEDLWRQKVAFDPYWDFTDSTALFCTEFVSEVLKAGGGQVPALVPLTSNPSLRTVLTWFGARNDMSLPAGTFATGHRVAAISQWGSFAAVNSYFEAKRELHRRFTADQKIGNLMMINGMDVALRPEIAQFLDRAIHLFDGRDANTPADDVITEEVRRLADELLGPWPGPAPAQKAILLAPPET
jgi:hypothetical protein